MSERPNDFDALLDRTARAVREDALPAGDAEAASQRVWARLQAARDTGSSAPRPVIAGCEAFQRLMQPAAAGRLPEAERVLLADHLDGCATCRRAQSRLRSGLTVVGESAAPAAVSTSGWRPLAAAAAIAILAAAGVWLGRDLLRTSPTHAILSEAPSGVIRLGADVRPISQGTSVRYGETIRAPKQHGALLTLEDGSRVELRERTEVLLNARGRDTEIQLLRGNVIVEASPQGSGHLWVATADARVAVVGTVFTVTHGLGGSRVSVLEGRVEVDEGGTQHVLLPGDQLSSASGGDRVPLAEEIAWSTHRERHAQLLAELEQLAREIDAIPGKSARFDTRLLDLMPQELAFYGAVPNIADTVSEAHRLFLSHVASNPALGAWWAEHDGARVGAALDGAIARFRAFGAQIGEEITVGATITPEGGFGSLLVLTTLNHPTEFPAFAAQQLQQMQAEFAGAASATATTDTPSSGVERLPVRFLSGPHELQQLAAGDATAAPDGAPRELLVLQQGDLLAASTTVRALVDFSRRLPQTGDDASSLRAGLRARYQRGVTWIGAADLSRLLDRARRSQQGATLETAGVLDARQLYVESVRGEFQATLHFAGPRHHVAAWLAEPAAMGALDFVSPNAYLASAVVFKDPSAMLADLDTIAADHGGGISQFFDQLLTHTGVDLRHDLIEALGGELAFAIDGPVAPVPAWKLVLEVYDPNRLQATLERLVAHANTEFERAGSAVRLAIGSSQEQGRQVHRLGTADGTFTVSYTFVDGYLVAASQQPLLLQALRERADGLTLVHSGAFNTLWPGNHEVSALAFSHLGPLAKALQAAGSSASIPAELQSQLQVLGDSGPALSWAVGAPQSITIGGTGRGLGSSLLGALVGVSGPRVEPSTGEDETSR